MACTGVLGFAIPPLTTTTKSNPNRNRKDSSISCCSTSTTLTNEQETTKKFTYSRASPSVRWPHLTFNEPITETRQNIPIPEFQHQIKVENEVGFVGVDENDDALQVFDKRLSRNKMKKMNKLALKRAKDWRQRVQYLTDRIMALKSEDFVADVLDEKTVQMTPTDYCFLVKWIGQLSWQRALEVYEWLNLRRWYAPNARMLATILSVLGKANQEGMAVEIFMRAEANVGNTVQVYNAMMGVYARNGRFGKVKRLLELMRERGCEPDLVSFNTLINARLKSGPMTLGLGIELLNDVRRSGIRPDTITYNTIISGCSRDSNLDEAVKVFSDMEANQCQADLWTYNAMVSVYGRCGLSGEAERLVQELGSKGFFPDAVTYNSLLYAFAREGNVVKVKEFCQEMVEMGFAKDEMTYNTLIHMYGKRGQHDIALKTYRDMKSFGRNPDSVTYTVLIDSLGKASKMIEAANVMSEMLNAGIKPTLHTYSALICGYAKSGQREEAEEMFNCMIRSGIKPDNLAYSVMLDMHLRSNNSKKALVLYQEMVRNGYKPDLALYEGLFRVLGKENSEKCIQNLVKDLGDIHGLGPEMISSLLSKSECYDSAGTMLKLAVMQGYGFDHENLLSILSSYSLSGRSSEAVELLNFIQPHVSESQQLINDALVVIHCKARQVDSALDEYRKNSDQHIFGGSCAMYESLIKSCWENERFSEASQIYSDMKFYVIEPSADIYQTMALVYCKMDFPETAYHLVDLADRKGLPLNDESIFTCLIESYGKLKQLEKAEHLFISLKQRYRTINRQLWNALIQAYAANGCYEKARAAFDTMIRDGPSPTVDTINGLLQALIVDGRLNELYVAIQDLQDMGFKISKSSIILMLEAFAKSSNIFEVKKIYNGMKAAGYLPTMHLFKVMIGLLSRGKQVRDVEAMVSEMEEGGFAPDITVYNMLLTMYTKIEDFKKTIQVYRRIQDFGLKPDEETYNTLILMYCRDRRPEEAASLVNEMRKLDLSPNMDTYKSLIAAFCKQFMIEQAEEVFEGLVSEGQKLDRSFYHLMMKMYRSSGNHSQAENMLVRMKESRIEPTIATMHLLMTSYGSSGHPMEAEKVLNNLKLSDTSLGTLPYCAVIDAYLKNCDYDIAIKKLREMKQEGLDPDHRIWTCLIRAVSLCHSVDKATTLLNAIADFGFHIPLRILTENSKLLLSEIDSYLKELEPIDENAALNFVNALEDMLWAFEQRATATLIFQLAIKRNIYHHDVFRVAEKDWGADFRKLSAGAALVGLTLWLDHMQDASLQGSPESPKSVVLITGAAEYNNVSLNSTLKAYLWEMGSPFLPCKTRDGLLVAQAHSLRLWLKDSPFCLDLELKNSPILPKTNSMQLVEGCYIRKGLVPAFKDIRERLGHVSPRKFARLALLSDEKRDKVINADIEGKREKLAKKEINGVMNRNNMGKFNHRKFTRRNVFQEQRVGS